MPTLSESVIDLIIMKPSEFLSNQSLTKQPLTRKLQGCSQIRMHFRIHRAISVRNIVRTLIARWIRKTKAVTNLHIQ